MKIFDKFLQYWKTIRIFLLYMIAILLVFWMYPREGKFQYEYEKGRPWKHENLIAPFDFPVYKDEAKISSEIDSVTVHNTLYFSLDTSVSISVLANFQADIETSRDGVFSMPFFKSTYKKITDTLPGVLKEVYSRGVIESNPLIQRDGKRVSKVIVVRRQIAEENAVSDLMTQKMAYEFVMNTLKGYASITEEQILSDFTIVKYIQPNIIFNESMTSNVLAANLEEISTTQGMVQSGQIIIARGELVSSANYNLIESLRREYETNPNVSRNYSLMYLAQFILVSILFGALLWYVSNFRRDMMGSSAQTMFLLSLIVIMVALTKVTVENEAISYYVIPFAIIPIFLKTFFNVRFALFVHFLILLLASFWIPNSYQFILMNFLAGVVAVFSMRSYYRRSILFTIASFITLIYSVIYVTFALLQEGTLEGVDWTQILWFGGNGLLILTVYPLIYIFEKLFGFLSDATLFELADTNQPLLRQLAEKAPGTFQHSLQVASLAEEAVLKVGGNPLLVRTGALYHDIGKMKNPFYFIENQRTGENPHDQLDYKASTKVVIDHVLDGLELAKRSKLPKQIIDFILTHHGTSTVQYFYKSYISDNPNEDVDKEEFAYPGPKPYMKEMAVVMIADSVEAASRSMKNISAESLSDLVDNIVAHQAAEEQYSEADITFGDISVIKEIFKKKLINIYHARIEYPK
ncbi:MAG: HDIG domain-containing protein [Bacteroidales bacterium]|jgi:putative nucleotidyltransferase with HDIG domain|nr:HDIG domain-containing protein [Bacteroidales bacterium]